MNPKGDKGKNGLSVYVDASAFLPNTAVSSIYEKFKLRLLNQKSTNYVEKPCKRQIHFDMEIYKKTRTLDYSFFTLYTVWQFYARERVEIVMGKLS